MRTTTGSQKGIGTGFLIIVLLLFATVCQGSEPAVRTTAKKPNIIVVLADDLGISELGCYGNQVIRTPNIDQLSREGITFSCAYSGSTVCAPARCSLMTGQHAGQCSVRVNTGGVPLPDADVTIAEVLKSCGYRTGGFGKWALGIEGSEGDPLNQGFDEFYGYYHQTHAHNHYPEYLVHNGLPRKLEGNFETNFGVEDGVFLSTFNPTSGKKLEYAPYAVMEQAKDFIKRNADKPFFCYLPVTPPHGPFHIPGNDPATKGVKDQPWSNTSKGVASMTQLLDRQMGELMELLKDLKIDDNTIVVFCSDHGAAKRLEGELDRSGPFRGQKRSVYEGGLRTPLIVRWPNAIKAGTKSDLPVYLGDLFATFREVVSDESSETAIARMVGDQPQHTVSFLPTLLGDHTAQKKHEFLVWDWAAFNPHVNRWYGRRQAIRAGDWKLLRHDNDKAWELYDLAKDPFESNDVSKQNPQIVKALAEKMAQNILPTPPQNEALVQWMRTFTWANRGKGIRLRASSLDDVIAKTPAANKEIEFSDDAVLRGATSIVDSEGNLHLNFAWDLKAGRRPTRFIHVCDSSGKTIHRGAFDEELFSESDKAKKILDYVAIRADELESASFVAIGFYDQQRKSAVVTNGPQAKRSRLTVWEKAPIE